MNPEKTLEAKNFFYNDETSHDERIFSTNPKDWDAIEDLNMTDFGYYDLPSAYLEFREKLPSKTETTFFIDGMFITAKPGEMPADIYLMYEEMEKNNPINGYWWKNKAEAISYNIRRYDWIPEIQPENNEKLTSSVIKEIIPIFLTKLQPKAMNTDYLSKQDLYYAYKESICNSVDIEKHISFEQFISDINFTIGVANWVYAPRIATSLQNNQLKKELKDRFYKKRLDIKETQSQKWYKKYLEYQDEINETKDKDIYTITFSSFFQDLDAWQSIEQSEKFKVKKEDLFNPFSIFYINNVIKAKMNKDFATQALSINESVNISSLTRDYQIFFGYKYNKEKGKWVLPNNKHYPKTASIYSVQDLAFGHIAKWQKQLKRLSLKNNEKSR